MPVPAEGISCPSHARFAGMRGTRLARRSAWTGGPPRGRSSSSAGHPSWPSCATPSAPPPPGAGGSCSSRARPASARRSWPRPSSAGPGRRAPRCWRGGASRGRARRRSGRGRRSCKSVNPEFAPFVREVFLTDGKEFVQVTDFDRANTALENTAGFPHRGRVFFLALPHRTTADADDTQRVETTGPFAYPPNFR
jgi:hypothetical protein